MQISLPFKCLEFILGLVTRGRVISGPFAGLRLTSSSVWFNPWPYLLGTYELELHGWIRNFSDQNWSRIVDVGAADGFYAVGLARMLGKESAVIAFEAMETGRKATADLAELNHLANSFIVKGTCFPIELEQVLDGSKALVIMDVEGAEKELLDLELIPSLAFATILVECHDLYVSGISDTIRDRFSNTHHIEAIESRQRVPGDLSTAIPKIVRLFFEKWLVITMTEGRESPQLWLRLIPK